MKLGFRAPTVLFAASLLVAVAFPVLKPGSVRLAHGTAMGVDRSPLMLALSADGTRLYTANRTANTVTVLDTSSRRVLREIRAGAGPAGIAAAVDGRSLVVANRLADSVSVIDTQAGRELRTIRVGNQPFDVLAAPDGTIYVTNVGSEDSVSVIDGACAVERKRIRVAGNPRCLALSPDGKRLYVTCDRYDLTREVCVIDRETHRVTLRIPLAMTSNLRGIAAAGEELLLVAHLNPRPFAPLTQVQQGWVNTNALSFIFLHGERPERISLLLDEVLRYHANPYGIALSPDRRFAYVTCSGDDSVAVVDLRRATDLIRRTDPARRERLGSTLGLCREFVTARIAVGRNPSGVAMAPDGKWVYVANHLDNSVSVIDTARQSVAATIPVGSAPVMTPRRRGEILFHSASICFQRQFSCASCHPEGHATGLSWDLEDDGLGTLKNVKSFRGVKGSGPFRWQGEALAIGANECGPTVTGAMRGEPLSETDLSALATYVESMPLMPNPFRGPAGELSAAAKRGRALFMGRAGCNPCHTLPLTTNGLRADVGTGTGRHDSVRLPNGRWITPIGFDVPHLRGAWDSAPYLHDGRAKTLCEVLTTCNPENRHGSVRGLTRQQLDDLIAFVHSL